MSLIKKLGQVRSISFILGTMLIWTGFGILVGSLAYVAYSPEVLAKTAVASMIIGVVIFAIPWFMKAESGDDDDISTDDLRKDLEKIDE
jgi:Ca2+/H+ antiporter